MAQNPWRQIFNTARLRAKKENVPFTLTYNDLPDYYDCVCPVFGVKLEKGKRPWCPSIDRLDKRKGYVKGNVIVVSYKVNRIKSDATIRELVSVAEFYRNLKECV